MKLEIWAGLWNDQLAHMLSILFIGAVVELQQQDCWGCGLVHA